MIKILDNVTDGEPCIGAFTFQTSFYGLDSWDKRQVKFLHVFVKILEVETNSL